MASSVTGTDKFLQLVPIFSPRPTMSGIFHKFGSISTLAAPRRKPMETDFVSCLEDNDRLSLNKYLYNNVRKTPGNVDQTPITEARGPTLWHFTQIDATFIQWGVSAILTNDRDLRPLSEDCLCVWGPMMPVAQSVASKFSKLYFSKIMQRRVASWCAFCDLNPGPTPFNCWDQEVSQMWFFSS